MFAEAETDAEVEAAIGSMTVADEEEEPPAAAEVAEEAQAAPSAE